MLSLTAVLSLTRVSVRQHMLRNIQAARALRTGRITQCVNDIVFGRQLRSRRALISEIAYSL